MREKVEREGVGKKKLGEGSNHPKGYIHMLDQEATTFFFTNLPKNVKEKDLWFRFACYGSLGEVYIPNKVDKQGHRFGFVKFREVKDAVELLRSISDIWFGSFKLRVNRANFRKNSKPEPKVTPPNGQRREMNVIQGIMSFKGALVKGRVDKGLQVVDEASPFKQEVIWEVEVEDEMLMKLRGAYVGYLAEDKEAKTIQNQFRMDGFQKMKICSLRFRKILLWSEMVD
jgi:RNA recognition motif-containing protein